MTYSIEVYVKQPDGTFEWKKLRPSHGEPYVFADKAEASRNMRMCYPDSIPGAEVRIVENP